MRERPSSRLLIVDEQARLLLFLFVHKNGPLAGQRFWATPGGGLESQETFEAAARRELMEETGLTVDQLGEQVATRRIELQLPDGEHVISDERYFLVRVTSADVSREHWTEFEQQVMSLDRWWTAAELGQTTEQVWPENIIEMVKDTGAWAGAPVRHPIPDPRSCSGDRGPATPAPGVGS